MKRYAKWAKFALLLTVGWVFVSCGGNKKGNPNWLKEDDVDVAIDETFRPVMENLVETFGMTKTEATMKPLYVSEDSALRLLTRDSLRCCIVTRKLNANELAMVEGHTLGAKQALIATDAIALVVNKANKDSLITVDEVKQIMQGKITKWEQLKHHSRTGNLGIVFDHSGSSTVRYMRDSLSEGRPLAGPVYASEKGTNLNVLEMVKNNPNVIGVVGTNWLKGNADSPLANFDSLDVNVMRVAKTEDDLFVRPFQYYIATGDYPLLRSVYIITTDPRSQSMVKLFYFFVKGQKGQTIICNNSQLLPITPVQVKTVSVN